MTGLLWLAPVRMPAQGTAAPSGEKQPEWKDRAEYDLYDAITKDTNPKSRLEKLQQWEKQYATTEWIKARRQLFLTTYVALSQPKEAVGIAKQILADNPKDFSGLYYTMLCTRPLAGRNAPPDVLDQGEKAANAILANIDTPPPNVTPADWDKARKDVENLAHGNLAWIAVQRKNWDAAEGESQKSLQLNPNNGEAMSFLGTALASQKNPQKMPAALFYFARAATYEGAGALDPDSRKRIMEYVQRAYKTFHGGNDGFDALMAAAKSSPTPPADFKIEDAKTIQDRKDKEAAEAAAKNPELTLWKNIKAELTGPNGASYFESSMKGAAVPTLKGKVVSLQPAVKPKTIVMALEDGTTADATLKFEAALPGKVEPGTELSFEGVPDSYTASPFMVVFNVDKDTLHGWTGKNAPAAPVRRRPNATSKK